MPQHDESSRNPGIALDLGWVEQSRINLPAVRRRVETHKQRRTVKKKHQLGWILRAISVIDLTTLAGDDTPTNVHRLCLKVAEGFGVPPLILKQAKHPVRSDFEKSLGITERKLTCGAVCVYPNRVKDAVKSLRGTGIPVASVAAGFPAGQTPHEQRIAEIKQAVSDGAGEIDIVISREHVIAANWPALYSEVRAFRDACGHAHLKTILATGELPTMAHVYKASLVAMMAGADFIKTSTGKESINATLEVGLVMMRAVREFHERTGHKVGFKPAGGIRSCKDALAWLSLMLEELGEEWTHPNLFRIGASSLLLDLERQLEHGLSGHYAAKYYMPMA